MSLPPPSASPPASDALALGLRELRLAALARQAGQADAAAAHLDAALAALQADAGLQAQEGLAAVHLEYSLLREARLDWHGALDSFKRHATLREAWQRALSDQRNEALALRLALAQDRLEAELSRRRGEEAAAMAPRQAPAAATGAGAQDGAVLQDGDRDALDDDPLTGLATRRQLERSVAELARRLPGLPLTLLVADIDHFKRINDGWSRAVGDSVLKAFALRLRAESRPHDVLARTGGAEFVVAFGSAMSLTRATLVAERLRAAVEAHDWASVEPGFVVTASIGVAVSAPGEALASTLARAAQALQACKSGGRNQVRCAG